jgi:hypothetical protein
MTRAMYKYFTKKFAEDRACIDTLQEEMFHHCVVLPEGRGDRDALLDREPGLAARVTNEALRLAEGEEAKAAKKA